MRHDVEVTSDCVGWASGDTPSARQVTSLGLESFEVVW
jgi:hypothetical protein